MEEVSDYTLIYKVTTSHSHNTGRDACFEDTANLISHPVNYTLKTVKLKLTIMVSSTYASLFQNFTLCVVYEHIPANIQHPQCKM